jgi:hypothetical protein
MSSTDREHVRGVLTTVSLMVVLACTLGAADQPASQSIPIAIVDFYGLNRVPADRVRAALPFKEGDAVSVAGDARSAFVTAAETQAATVPGVSRARVTLVCCENGGAIVYVGIEERGSAPTSFRAAPTGNARLAADVVQAGEQLAHASRLAVERGDAGEEHTQGHALSHDPATRALQDRFVLYANRDLPELRRVLRTSSNAAERALAAHVLGYAADKEAVVADLQYGMSDPSEDVRNDAMRALMVIADMTPGAGKAVPRIPVPPFIALLNSPVWSDRNKASGALMALTKSRDPRSLEALRQPQPIAALAEMARWKSEGHAQLPFFVLARIAGYADDAAFDFWRRGEREVVIKAAANRLSR